RRRPLPRYPLAGGLARRRRHRGDLLCDGQRPVCAPDRPARPVRLYLGASPAFARRPQASDMGHRARHADLAGQCPFVADGPRLRRADPRDLGDRPAPEGSSVMSYRTPLARVRGLGSAKGGTDHFWMQRLTAAFNLLLVGFFIFLLVPLAGADY